jgi:cobalt-zinc-cadmium efflux system protein
MLLVLGLALCYVVAEVVGGVLTHSLALVADAGHMLTDVLGLGMAVAAMRFARRPPTASKTYGFHRTEVLAALINGVMLVLIAVYIVYQAWQRLQVPENVEPIPMLVIASGGVLVTLISVRLLHAGAAESLNVRGAFLEVLGDLLGALGTVAAALIILLTGWTMADPLISVGIAVLIVPRAWALLNGVVEVLLEAAPTGLDMPLVEKAVLDVPGVVSIHDLHVWCITSGFIAMSAHVLVNGRLPNDVLHDLRDVLEDRFGIEHITLQVEEVERAGDGVWCTQDGRCFGRGQPATQPARSRE